MKKVMLLLTIIFMCFLFSCSDENSSDKTSKIKIGAVLGVSGLGDLSFNDLVYAGLEKAKTELNVEFDYVEPKRISDFELFLRDMANSGEYQIIISIGFDQVDALTKIASEFEGQNFAIIDGIVESTNVVSYISKEEEGSFLVGALASLMKKESLKYGLKDNETVGFVAALDIPLLNKFYAGYEAGVLYVNPNSKVIGSFIGGNTPFSDVSTTKEIGKSQFSSGADIIYHAAGGAGIGLFQAAAEYGFFAIGCNANQNHLYPDNIVASMMKNVDVAAYEIVEATLNNKLSLGETIILGVKSDGVGYDLDKSNIEVSEDIILQLENIKEDIVNGKLIIPYQRNQVSDFLEENKF